MKFWRTFLSRVLKAQETIKPGSIAVQKIASLAIRELVSEANVFPYVHEFGPYPLRKRKADVQEFQETILLCLLTENFESTGAFEMVGLFLSRMQSSWKDLGDDDKLWVAQCVIAEVVLALDPLLESVRGVPYGSSPFAEFFYFAVDIYLDRSFRKDSDHLNERTVVIAVKWLRDMSLLREKYAVVFP